MVNGMAELDLVGGAVEAEHAPLAGELQPRLAGDEQAKRDLALGGLQLSGGVARAHKGVLASGGLDWPQGHMPKTAPPPLEAGSPTSGGGVSCRPSIMAMSRRRTPLSTRVARRSAPSSAAAVLPWLQTR